MREQEQVTVYTDKEHITVYTDHCVLFPYQAANDMDLYTAKILT